MNSLTDDTKNIFNTYSESYLQNQDDLQFAGWDEDSNPFWTDSDGNKYYESSGSQQNATGGGDSGTDDGSGAGNGGGNAPAYNYNSGYSPGNYGAGSYGPQNVGMGNYGPPVNPYGPVVNPSGVLTSWPGSQNNVFGGAATYNGSMPGANDIPQTAGPDKYSQQSIQLLALSNDRVQQAINSGMAVVMSRDNVVGGNPVQKSVVLSPGNPGAGIYTVGFTGPLNTDGTLIPNQAIQYTYPALPGTADSTDVESTGGDGGASGSGSNDCDCGGGTGGASGGSGGASGGGGTGGPSGGTGSDTTGTGTGQTPSVTNTNTTTDASTVTTNDKNPVLSSAKTVTHKKPATASKQQVAPKYFYDPNYTWVGPNEYVDHSHSPQSAVPPQNQVQQNQPKKSLNNSNNNQTHTPGHFNKDDAVDGLRYIYDHYGKDMAQIIEKMYRNETRNFTSGQYKNTGTGGMEVGKWNTSLWKQHPELAPIGTWSAYENKGASEQGGNKQVTDRPKVFYVLPSVRAAMIYKAEYIKRYGGNFARWHAVQEIAQEAYRRIILNYPSPIVNSF